MSNPSLPPIPEPSWPIQELSELARTAATLLDARRVWVALPDRHGGFAPGIAVANDTGLTTPTDPRRHADLIKSVVNLLLRGGSAAPLVFPNVLSQPELARLVGADAAAMRSLAAIALVSENRMIGALIVTSAQAGPLSEGQRQVLTTLASQAVATIRLNAAVERNAAQARVMGALLSASQALTSSLDPTQVFGAIIQSIQGVISFESALIYRYEESAGLLRVIAGVGAPPDALEGAVTSINDPKSRAARVAKSLRYFSDVVRPEDEIGPHTDKLRAGATISLLCVPLLSKGLLCGVASLARQHAFNADEVKAMQRLSPIAAAALENVELYHRSQAERQQLAALFASASDGFAMIDDTLRFTQVNPAFARYVAADQDALLGQPCCDVFDAATEAGPNPETCLLCRGAPDCLLRQVMRSGVALDHVECVFPPPAPRSAPPPDTDGLRPSEGPPPAARTIDFSLTPMQTAERRPRLLLVGRDVSAPREVQRVRAEQIQLISHEMGTPLQTIGGNIEIVLSFFGQTLAPEPLKLLNVARATTYSMRTLVADLDLISRKDAGQWTITPVPMDLDAEARTVVVEMNVIAQQKGIDLQMTRNPPLPQALADPARVQQVARNLIINAIKFTPPGGHVRVAVEADTTWVTLKVADTGMGIPRELYPLIWRRLYQGPQPKGAGATGRGLGLAIVRIIAEAHGAVPDVQSEVGKGTTFTVSFPRADRGARG